MNHVINLEKYDNSENNSYNLYNSYDNYSEKKSYNIICDDINNKECLSKSVENNILKIYSDYYKIFNSNIIILKSDTEYFYTYLHTSYDISDFNLDFVKIDIPFYKATNKISTLYEQIPLLLYKNFSVIILNKDDNIIAIHHPANTHNKINMSFCFLT